MIRTITTGCAGRVARKGLSTARRGMEHRAFLAAEHLTKAKGGDDWPRQWMCNSSYRLLARYAGKHLAAFRLIPSHCTREVRKGGCRFSDETQAKGSTAAAPPVVAPVEYRSTIFLNHVRLTGAMLAQRVQARRQRAQEER